MEKAIVTWFLVWRLLLIFVVIVAALFVPTTGKFFPELLWQRGLPPWVWAWANFDGVHYVSIAKSGYFFNQQPFFPLYPFAIQLVNELVGFHRFPNGYIISAQVVSSAAFIISLFLVVKLLKEEKSEGLTRWVLGTIFLFPTAFFYTAAYNDALFLLFSCLTILWCRQRQFLLAGVAGALATLTRLNGLALIFLVLAEYVGLGWTWRDWGAKLRRIVSWEALHASGVLFIPAAFLSYLFYIQKQFDTWRWIFTSMSVWQQDKLTFPVQVFWRYLKILFLDRSLSFTYWIAVMEFGFVLFYLFLLLYGIKKIRFSFWIFCAVSLLMPMLTGTFQGMPRYILHLSPMFFILGILLSRLPRSISYSMLILFGIGQIILLSLFSRGWFIA